MKINYFQQKVIKKKKKKKKKQTNKQTPSQLGSIILNLCQPKWEGKTILFLSYVSSSKSF